jgi:hypothetical protein
MSQAGELYVDVGLRGLDQSLAGLDNYTSSVAGAASLLSRAIPSGASAASSALSGLAAAGASAGAAIASGVGLAVAAIGGLAAATGAAAAGVTAMLASLGESEDAGRSLKSITFGWNQIWELVRLIKLEFGEIVARTFDFRGAISTVTRTVARLWVEWKPTLVAALDLTKTVLATTYDLVSWTVSGIASQFDGLFKSLGVNLNSSSKDWATTVKSWIESVQFFIENWKLYLDLGWERLKLFADNSWERIKTFFVNGVELAKWFGDNFGNIITDLGTLIGTVFSNSWENIKSGWASVLEYMSTGKWSPPEFKGITDGFKSAISEMPKFTAAAVADSNAAIDGINQELANRREAFNARIAARDRERLGNLRGQAGPKPEFGFVGFAELAKRDQENTLKVLAERQAKAAEQAAAGILKLAEAANGQGVNVKRVGDWEVATFG